MTPNMIPKGAILDQAYYRHRSASEGGVILWLKLKDEAWFRINWCPSILQWTITREIVDTASVLADKSISDIGRLFRIRGRRIRHFKISNERFFRSELYVMIDFHNGSLQGIGDDDDGECAVSFVVRSDGRILHA